MDQDSVIIRGLQTTPSPHSLRNAAIELNKRGLVQSALWVTKLLSAITKSLEDNDLIDENNDSIPLSSQTPPLDTDTFDPTYLTAKALFDNRQYRATARELRNCNTRIGQFLRWYSTFLAGERRKEEERQELADWTEPINIELDQLKAELLSLCNHDNFDAFAWYMLGTIFKRMKQNPEAINAFQKSLSLFPYNWGVWLELASLCEAKSQVLSLKVGDDFMKMLFLAHFLNETDEADQARDIYESILSNIPSSLFVKGQLALSLYNMRMFDEAQNFYDEIFAEDETCLDGADVYANILFVKEDKFHLSLLANRCIKIDKYRLETCCVIGNYYSLRGQHDQALVYFQRALKLNRNYLSAWTLMGHEFLEERNSHAAVEAYRRAIDINPKDFRAWYALGQTYEILHLPLYALYYYQKAAALRPRDARMWCAVGQILQELRRWDEAIQCYDRAVGCDDREGLALAKLADLYDRMGRDAQKDGRQHERVVLCFDRAAHYYAANLARRDKEELGGKETADALRFLAEFWFEKDELDKAKEYCVRLLDYPGSHKDFVKKLLRQMHKKESRE